MLSSLKMAAYTQPHLEALSKSMLMLNQYRIKLPALKNLGDKEWKELLRD